MGGLISTILVVAGAIYYFSMRLTGNKEAAQIDDMAGGAAWFVSLIGGIFFFLIYVIPNVSPLIDKYEEPVKTILMTALIIISIYVPYKIACFLVPIPTENKDKEE